MPLWDGAAGIPGGGWLVAAAAWDQERRDLQMQVSQLQSELTFARENVENLDRVLKACYIGRWEIEAAEFEALKAELVEVKAKAAQDKFEITAYTTTLREWSVKVGNLKISPCLVCCVACTCKKGFR